MNNFYNLAIISCYILAVLGGIGYTMYDGAYLISFAIAALGYMAWDKFYNAWKELNN